MADNPRGLAFVFLRNAWRHMQRWEWVNMLQAVDDFPTIDEWTDAGLAIWDRSEEQTVETLEQIVKSMQKSARHSMRGIVYGSSGSFIHRYGLTLDTPRGDDGEEDGAWLTHVERGYGEIEDEEELVQALAVVAKVLRPGDMLALLAYVEGYADSLAEACYMHGMSVREYNAAKNRIRRNCTRHLRIVKNIYQTLTIVSE